MKSYYIIDICLVACTIIYTDAAGFQNPVLPSAYSYISAHDACIHRTYACMHTANTREKIPKPDSNTKFLLTSWILDWFQRFFVFWKAGCLLFHLETTFLHCFVFVRSKTWHLWKVCLKYWTNTEFHDFECCPIVYNAIIYEENIMDRVII